MNFGVSPTVASGASTTPSVVLPGTTAGHGVVVALAWSDDTATISNCTVSGEANASLKPTYTNGTLAVAVALASLPLLTSGGSKTISATLSASCSWTMYALTLAQPDQSSFSPTENGASGNSANPSVTLSAPFDNMAIFAIYSSGLGGPTPGSGYTAITLTDISGAEDGEYKLNAGAAGSKIVDVVQGAGQWVLASASFKEAVPPTLLAGGFL